MGYHEHKTHENKTVGCAVLVTSDNRTKKPMNPAN